MLESFPAIEKLLAEVARFQLAVELLEAVWNDVGPYNTGQVSQETLTKLQRFFKFDDSE